MPVLANLINTDLSRGFTVAQVAEKHGWTDPMVWSWALEDKNDRERFKELGWGLRIYGNSMIVTKDSEMTGPGVSLRN